MKPSRRARVCLFVCGCGVEHSGDHPCLTDPWTRMAQAAVRVPELQHRTCHRITANAQLQKRGLEPTKGTWTAQPLP